MAEMITCLLFLTVGFLMGKITKPVRITITTNAKATEAEEEPAIKIPNPMQAYRDHKQQKVEDEELARLERIIDNIENYDGTGANQKDI